jgi:hypothetical protein
MNIDNISLERLEQIEREREETQSDPAYHNWIKELNVSRSYSRQDGLHNARHMMGLWDADRYGRPTGLLRQIFQ